MLEDRLLAGDEGGALAVCEEALGSWADPAALHLEVVAPALRDVGDRWASGQLSVADEHRATVVAARVVARLGPRFVRPGRSRGTVVLGIVSGDAHALPATMAADLVRRAGFRVVELGVDTPAESFAQAARSADRLVAVAVGATRAGLDDEVARVVAAVGRVVPGVPVIAGGAGVASRAAAAAVGADHWSGPEASGVVDVLEAVTGSGDGA
jgi:methanogenic corrinoid protein MtbC1